VGDSNGHGAAADTWSTTTQAHQSLRGERTHLGRASVLYSASGIIGKVGALLTVPIVTRALGATDYGLLDLAVSLMGLATMVGGFSAELPAARLISERPVLRSAVLSTYVATATALTLLAALAIASLSGAIAQDIWLRPDARGIVLITAAAISLNGIQLATWNLHRIRNRPRVFAWLSVIDMTLKVSLIWAAAITGGGAQGIITVYLVAAGIGAVLGLWTARRDLVLQGDLSFVPPLLRGGALFTIMAVAFVGSTYASRALVAEFGGGEAVGAMALALKVASVLALPLRGFQLAWGPASVTAVASERSRQDFSREIVAVLWAGGLSALALGAVAPEVVLVAGGASFSAAASAVPGFSMATALAAAFFMVGVACVVSGTPVWKAGLAAAGGAFTQVLVTAAGLDSVGAQVAAGTGAVVGQATAIVILLALSDGAVAKARVIIAISIGAVVASVCAGAVMELPFVAARWAVGLAVGAIVAWTFWQWSSTQRRGVV
jgi:O-antigen/teichoic acid export membrane protein